MKKKNQINLIEPKPYQKIGAKFIVSGRVPETWLKSNSGIDYRIFTEFLDINGKTFMGGSINVSDIKPPKSWWPWSNKGKIYFNEVVQLHSVSIGFLEKSQGRIVLKLKGQKENEQCIFVPLVLPQFTPKEGVDSNLINQHGKVGEIVKQYEQDIKNYYKEWTEIHNSFQHNKEDEENETAHINDTDILWGMFELLGESESTHENSPYVKEIKLKEKLAEKYKDALNWRGPLAGATIFRIDGFLFKVHSQDHGKHFHIIHKGKGIDARFSFPELELINYKSLNTLSRKQEKSIKEFLKSKDNFKKLEKEFTRRDVARQ